MITFVGKTSRNGLRPITLAALSAAVVVSMIGCTSALRPNDTVFHIEGFKSSPMPLHAQNFVLNPIVPTITRPVQELSRVDSPGPDYTRTTLTEPINLPTQLAGEAFYPVQATVAATGPATTQPTAAETRPGTPKLLTIDDAMRYGAAAARLNEDAPVKDLSLQDAIVRTAKHSLDIKVEAYNPAIKESQITEAEALFDPVIFGNSNWTNNNDPAIPTVTNTTPPTTTFTPPSTNGQVWQNQIGVKQMLSTGAQVQATAQWVYRDNVVAAGNANGYTNGFGVQITQPLLRGFGSEVNEANIYLAQRDYNISLSDFKLKAMNSVADAEDAYLNLVLARINVEILARLVVISQQSFEYVYERKDLDASEIEISESLSALETRKADLQDAQKSYVTASDRLKTLMNDPDFDINSNVLINPTDHPVAEPFTYNRLESIQTALQQRPEMRDARLQAERADIVVTLAKNDLLPKLDLTFGVASNGLDNSFDQSFSDSFNPRNLDWNLGLKFEIPIGDRGPEAAYQRRKKEREQAIVNIVDLAQKITQDVNTQLREVDAVYPQVEGRNRARLATANEFEKRHDKEEIDPKANLASHFVLIDNQARLAQSEQQLAQTIINYNLAIMRLEKAKGTLLEFDHISLDRPPPAQDNGMSQMHFLSTLHVTN